MHRLLEVQWWPNAVRRDAHFPRQPIVPSTLFFGLTTPAEGLHCIVGVGLLPILIGDHHTQVQYLQNTFCTVHRSLG